MSEFERVLPNYRLVATLFGEDLQAIAARTLNDANRWPELIWINELVWPYITDEPASVKTGVLLSGSLIKVPAPSGFAEDKSSTDDVYERDCRLMNKLLDADEFGDFVVVSGVDNLTQQLGHAVDTPRGQQRRHPNYGCMVWRILGTVNGPTAGRLGAEYIRATLEADYRVTSVTGAVADISGDSIKIAAQANALAGGSIKLKAGDQSS